jgi:sugar phosphate isomerase/epimerase
VYVHVNDAQANLGIDQQLDNVRDLPGATGVIDLAGFMRALMKIEYNGPVAVEPFKKELGQLANDGERLSKVTKALDGIMPKE